MGVNRFEDLRAWQAARKQCQAVGELITRPKFRQDVKLSLQINDASISVMNNVNEGFLRHRDREFQQFLRISAGSNGEVRSCLYAARDRNYLDSNEADELIEGTNISRLQNSIGG